MKKITFQKNNYRKGLTLIETVVYVAIFSMFVLSLSSFSGTINNARLRNQSILEISYQGSQIMNTMTQVIRNSVSITSPVISNSGTSLNLVTTNLVSTSTATFYVATGTLFMTEGVASPVALTNNRVKISNLVFSNLSRPSTPGTIRIRFTLQNSDTNARTEEQYTKDFYSSASIR